MIQSKFTYPILIAILLSLSTSQGASILFDFPSADSLRTDLSSSGSVTPLGAGGLTQGGALFRAGDRLDKSFSNTDLLNADSSRWVFQMSNHTSEGMSTFDIRIDGNTVGSFSFSSGEERDIDYDLMFSHPDVVLGPEVTLNIVATSTVPPGGGAWNWYSGGGCHAQWRSYSRTIVSGASSGACSFRHCCTAT